MKKIDNGLFVTLEGCDGSGKSTVAKELKTTYEKRGYNVVLTREPGGGKISEEIREILLDKNNKEMDDMTEVLLFAASRRQHMVDVILPALKKGSLVICDRFLDSSIAYQGYAREVGVDVVMKINKYALDFHYPDLTLYLDVDPEIAQKRIAERKKADRLDAEKLNFHKKVREGYLSTMSLQTQLIDANQPIKDVVKECCKIINQKL